MNIQFKVGDVVRPSPDQFNEDVCKLTFKITYVRGNVFKGVWSDGKGSRDYEYHDVDFIPCPEMIIDRLLEKYN